MGSPTDLNLGFTDEDSERPGMVLVRLGDRMAAFTTDQAIEIAKEMTRMIENALDVQERLVDAVEDTAAEIIEALEDHLREAAGE